MKKELTTKNKIQLGIVAFNVILFIIFIILNRELVEVNFIFAKIEVRRSIMLLATFAIGASAGWILKSWVGAKKRKEARAEKK